MSPAQPSIPGDCFAPDYAQARRRFLQAAQAATLTVHSEPHPLPGRDGEALAVDAVLDGAPDTQRLLIVSSGCHGIEGHAGSAVQIALLRDAVFRKAAHGAGVALLHLHALNPHGFSFGHRVTHENVDLNRNFVDFSQPRPHNPLLPRLAPVLLPERWPPTPGNRLALYGFALRHGIRATQTTISQGQYQDPEGLFFGGNGPSWSRLALERLLARFGSHARRIGWIDVHTGLGPNGVAERILAGRPEPVLLKRARAWWGPGLTCTQEGSSSSAVLMGEMWQAAAATCPQAELTAMVMEVGTQSKLKVLDALRGDQWLRLHPQAGEKQRAAIHQRMREAFYTETPAWQAAVLAQGCELALQAVRGLAAT
ncbi:M14 family metallopeptidase [Ideonella azotifigens]|uniref:M14 family metallopeptidase n=1 Tax=Ideonella azotifigens TaxID=513160 RepID=A0ABN1K1T5_9BURK|nr:M14 family metallopeptidase [Ideonella azotifigens]MCD2341778.1 M14 family metallopeptidase [Ideonella azotifigens]